MLKFHIDAKAIAEEFGEMKAQLEAELNNAVKGLAAMTYAKTLEKANKDLGSTRKKYADALSFEEIGDGIWAVTLDKGMVWLEEGQSEYDMRDTLLNKNFKVSKDGFKYRSIPFDHGKNPSEMSSANQDLVEQIKSAFKEKGITFKGIEKDSNGSPRVGKLHVMNIDSAKPSEKASHPALHGVTVYQSKGADGKVRRDILTFRTISTNPATEDKWQHPGTTARKFMDKAFEESMVEWETTILPAIMEKFGG